MRALRAMTVRELIDAVRGDLDATVYLSVSDAEGSCCPEPAVDVNVTATGAVVISARTGEEFVWREGELQYF